MFLILTFFLIWYYLVQFISRCFAIPWNEELFSLLHILYHRLYSKPRRKFLKLKIPVELKDDFMLPLALPLTKLVLIRYFECFKNAFIWNVSGYSVPWVFLKRDLRTRLMGLFWLSRALGVLRTRLFGSFVSIRTWV